VLVIGLMSGTSADGIDAAVVELSGAPPAIAFTLISHTKVDYAADVRAEVFACFRPESSSVDRLSRLNVRLGEVYAEAVMAALGSAGLASDQIDLVSSHGQTLWYDAPVNDTPGTVLTLGEPSIIAERTGITTISHLRSRDLAAGGRGAPLVGYLDWLLFRHPTRVRAIQNIGGIGNVTALPPLSLDASPLAFDTGPGNMVMDYCASRATEGAQRYDMDGRIAARGEVHAALLAELMQHPYIRQSPPKTTGRETFGTQFGREVWERGLALHLSPENIVATTTAFTAESIAAAYREWIPWPVEEMFVAGGGALNPTLIAMLGERLGGVPVHDHAALGLPAEAKEAVLFALLGYETWHGRPGTLPALTGASRPVVLGSITPGRLWRQKFAAPDEED
jgi:anhydro-N-acetylmuramic acid kinase